MLDIISGVACHSVCRGIYWLSWVWSPFTAVYAVCETACSGVTGFAGITAAVQGKHPYLAVATLCSTCGLGCSVAGLAATFLFRRWRAGKLPFGGKGPPAGGGSPAKKDL